MKLALLAGLHAVVGLVSDVSDSQACNCQESDAPSLIETSSHRSGLSLEIRQEHQGSGGLSQEELRERYEGRHELVEAGSLACWDDRVEEAVVAAPGGELGEFTVALAAYLQEKGHSPSQDVVDSLFASYVETVPPSRRISLCTDQQALQRVAAELQTSDLNAEAPSEHLKRSGLLESLSKAESQGDRHFRSLLQHPGEYQVPAELSSMVLKAFYRRLWSQEHGGSAKLKLQILQGDADPQAFLEVSCPRCRGVPALHPRAGPALISQLDALEARHEELARFFARASRSTPQKVGLLKLQERIERLALLGLEKSGRRMAAGLPFYSLTYSP